MVLDRGRKDSDNEHKEKSTENLPHTLCIPDTNWTG